MGDRFNSFYQEEQHPFVHAMLGVLGTALNKLRRLPLPSRFYAAQDKAFDADSEICRARESEKLSRLALGTCVSSSS